MRLITLAGGFDKNLCYLYAPEREGDAEPNGERAALLVDAAVSADEILDAAKRERLSIRSVLLTHAHHDHLWSADEVLEATGATLVAYPGVAAPAGLAGFPGVEAPDEAALEVGGVALRLLFTPGHEAHHLCAYAADDAILFTGDALFVGRTGRTVAAGASARVLYRSLRDKIAPLPGATRIYPGHDYGVVRSRTLAEERAMNPFLQCESEDAFVDCMERYERSRGSPS